MGFKVLAVLVVVLYAVSTIGALDVTSRDVGLRAGLSGWRRARRRTALIYLEVAAVAAAATGATLFTRWTAVLLTLVGIAAACALVQTLPKTSTEPSAAVTETTAAQTPTRQERPPPGRQSKAGTSPGPPERLPVNGTALGKSIWGVFEYGRGDQGRDIICQHALAYVDGTAGPAALCGYQYDAADVPPGSQARPWGIAVAKSKRCTACTQALRAQYYALWDIDPWILGRLRHPWP